MGGGVDGCRGGGLNYTDIFFKPTLFIYFCLFFCFCFVLEHSLFFSLSTGSQLIEISIEDTGTPPPWIIDNFLRGRGINFISNIDYV